MLIWLVMVRGVCDDPKRRRSWHERFSFCFKSLTDAKASIVFARPLALYLVIWLFLNEDLWSKFNADHFQTLNEIKFTSCRTHGRPRQRRTRDTHLHTNELRHHHYFAIVFVSVSSFMSFHFQFSGSSFVVHTRHFHSMLLLLLFLFASFTFMLYNIFWWVKAINWFLEIVKSLKTRTLVPFPIQHSSSSSSSGGDNRTRQQKEHFHMNNSENTLNDFTRRHFKCIKL